jgi:hypothetical protein
MGHTGGPEVEQNDLALVVCQENLGTIRILETEVRGGVLGGLPRRCGGAFGDVEQPTTASTLAVNMLVHRASEIRDDKGDSPSISFHPS